MRLCMNSLRLFRAPRHLSGGCSSCLPEGLMKKSDLLRCAVFVVLVIVCVGVSRAETLFSYVDQNGVRIFTNIAPKGPVQDLRMSGQTLPLQGTGASGGENKVD